MQRRGFLAALGALVVGGTVGKFAGAAQEHRHAATVRALFGRDWKLARGGVIQPGDVYRVGESINVCVSVPDAEHFRRLQRAHWDARYFGCSLQDAFKLAKEAPEAFQWNL